MWIWGLKDPSGTLINRTSQAYVGPLQVQTQSSTSSQKDSSSFLRIGSKHEHSEITVEESDVVQPILKGPALKLNT